jgi:hypothetical protein
VARPDAVITCIDCGGRAHLLTRPDVDPEAFGDDVWQPGDVATYRCADCLDRWDIVVVEGE